MKYNRFQQFISVAMALLVLVSTLSVSIEKHYCGDHLVDIAIFADVQKCNMEASDEGLESSDERSVLMAESCCKDVIDLYEGQDELSLEKTKVLNADQKVFIMSFAYVFSGIKTIDSQHATAYKYDPLPKTTRDIQVLNQVFLIWFDLIISELP